MEVKFVVPDPGSMEETWLGRGALGISTKGAMDLEREREMIYLTLEW